MNQSLNRIRECLANKEIDTQTSPTSETNAIALSMEIMKYAHQEQKRENGENYSKHPLRCFTTYQQLIGLNANTHSMDKSLMEKHHIPFDGVQEVCLLHDVIEDTELTIKDLQRIFSDSGFGQYFNKYVKTTLKCITHDKSVDYEEYINICLGNPISALVKMLDLQDNLRVLDLIAFNEDRHRRAQKYLSYLYRINNEYHFIENAASYREQYNSKHLL